MVDPLAARLHAVARHLEAHAAQRLTLRDLARRAGLSPARLRRAFTRTFGVSPRAYQAAARLSTFKRGLRAGDPVLRAGLTAGHGSTSRVHDAATGLGMTPSAYRAGGAGERIVWAVRPTPVGHLLMAATPRGVCAALLGDDPVALERELAAEFPRARLERAGAASEAPLAAWMAVLAEHLRSGGPAPDLPLDLRGTAFQLAVWRLLRSVPPGAPVSYAQVAAGVGAPRAVRAAASACAANRVAVLVPCHRALRADGGLGGYRWGVERKRALLALESAMPGMPRGAVPRRARTRRA